MIPDYIKKLCYLILLLWPITIDLELLPPPVIKPISSTGLTSNLPSDITPKSLFPSPHTLKKIHKEKHTIVQRSCFLKRLNQQQEQLRTCLQQTKQMSGKILLEATLLSNGDIQNLRLSKNSISTTILELPPCLKQIIELINISICIQEKGQSSTIVWELEW